MNDCSILLVDDFPGWRDQLRSLLKTRPEWNIIAEASNGKEAIEKATTTQPDIILLDVGLPFVNGIEAARIIRQKCPNTSVIFVNQQNDSDIKEAAIGTGAVNYILKTNVCYDLVNAISGALNHH